ncbi:hemerythrin domain-containing protein [Nocardioides sp. cx-169]|uniref:hemerythrin domain-containing protein n=1 Tax=Nocardioides sp. cx-169 TaxID=2899080 RepID=UPI001E307320|nr:hemerythrin domain-containing protein [Nocardioides sp. cx-169]MCD4532869.1 hemerythrin domain-containing protein [Nocardioides sp. cx-169]
MTSLAHQTVDQLGGPWSVLTRQKRDHERLDRLLHQLDGTSGVEQERVLHRIARLVFPHAFAEESVLWPELRRLLPEGHQLTLQVELEHQEVNELWGRLEDGSLSPSERREVLDRLVEVLREDVRDEEDELLPRLQEAAGPARLRQLGVAWEAVRRTAPTRPHPVVARRPPGNALAALPLTVIDHTRDLVDAAARRTSNGTATRLRTTSQAMARAAGRVERVGVLRRGEHRSTHRG